MPPAHAGRSPCARLGSAGRPLLGSPEVRSGAVTLDRSSAGGLEQSPEHRPPSVSPHVPQNVSEHLRLLSTARPGRSANVLGVSGKAVSLNGIKLTALADPQHSPCLPGKLPPAALGRGPSVWGQPRRLAELVPAAEAIYPIPGHGEPCLLWGRVLRGGPGGSGAEWQRRVTRAGINSHCFRGCLARSAPSSPNAPFTHVVRKS